jgi:hypothetical protein
MRTSILLFALLLSASMAFAQGRSMRVPPGIRQADQTEAQTDKNVPGPIHQHANIDATKLKRDADDLASLAQSIPTDVDATTRGMLPKDLEQKLKRIEKLAKHLRSALTP